MTVNKKLTIAEVEEKRAVMRAAVTKAIQDFESETGIKVGFIDTVRQNDEKESTNLCTPYSEDHGPIADVNINLRTDW
jgi:hypothetical protein